MKRHTVFLSTYINTVSDETYALFGPVINITKYLSCKFKELYMLKQPMSGEKILSPTLSYYVDGKEIWVKKMPFLWRVLCLVFGNKFSSEKTIIRLKIRDFISNFYFVLFVIHSPVDLFIGVESINSLAGFTLRLFKRVKLVLYFANDYHPRRYSKLMNNIFLSLDAFVSYRADYLWMMNPKIHESRIERGLILEKLAPQYIIHGGLPFFSGSPLPLEARKKNQIVYATRAGHGGLEIAIRAFKLISQEFTDATLFITGHADREKHLLDYYMSENGLTDKVRFTGFLKEKDLNNLVKESYIGLAIWPCDVPVSATYGDPEKIRRYFHFGLPVVATLNAFTADKVMDGAGLVVSDDVESISQAVLKLFREERFYVACMEKSADLGRHYEDRNPLDESFEDMVKMGMFDQHQL